jgi:hypothetical protein
MLVEPSGPGQEGWMTHTFKLERMDGTPADPPSFKTTVLVWAPGDQIPLGRKRFRLFVFATTTQASSRYWSLRTSPKERLAPSSDAASLRSLTNRDDIPTGQGGRQWWPSTVQTVLRRSGSHQTASG